ncbi:hypothetical protein T484DRAFT_1841630, partial [Baffinella frigidus]
DTEASALAIATSGNGLELLQSKLATFWIAAATVASSVSGFPGLEAWMHMDLARLSFIMAMTTLATLPLLAPSGRTFVLLLQWGVPACTTVVWLGFAFHGFTTGDFSLAGFWAAFMAVWFSLVWFRTRLFLRGFFITGCLSFFTCPTFACINYQKLRAVPYATYDQCIQAEYRALAAILGLTAVFVLILVGREFANNALTWRAARASRE